MNETNLQKPTYNNDVHHVAAQKEKLNSKAVFLASRPQCKIPSSIRDWVHDFFVASGLYQC